MTARPARQKALISALVECFFNVTAACEQTGIPRRTFYCWLENFPEFREGIESAERNVKDGLETALVKSAKAGDVVQIVAALRRILKSRGYSEREVEQLATAKVLDGVLDGTLTPREGAFKINGMGYPLPQTLLIELLITEKPEEDPGGPTSQNELERRAMEACLYQKYQFAGSFLMEKPR